MYSYGVADRGGTFVCSAHGKSRHGRYMEEDGRGGMRCIAGSECKGSGDAPTSEDSVRCSIHGKLRSNDCLEQDDSGAWVCKPGRRCKVTGDMPDRNARSGVGQDRPYGFGSQPIAGDQGMGMWPQANPMAWAQQAAAWYQAGGLGGQIPAWAATAGQMPGPCHALAPYGQMPGAPGVMPGGMPCHMNMGPWGMPGGMPGSMPGLENGQMNGGQNGGHGRVAPSRSPSGDGSGEGSRSEASRSRSRSRRSASSTSSSSSSSGRQRKKKRERKRGSR